VQKVEKSKIWENQEMNNPQVFALRDGVIMGCRVLIELVANSDKLVSLQL